MQNGLVRAERAEALVALLVLVQLNNSLHAAMNFGGAALRLLGRSGSSALGLQFCNLLLACLQTDLQTGQRGQFRHHSRYLHTYKCDFTEAYLRYTPYQPVCA
ncbi:hypothetical protein F5Y15DRAFT_402229 [Xylariaceae sp. FL0016]|nr:hypothetical protein F5Y15DRAFT_402229 [Xylariaceae sp. FL0016]